MILKLDEVAEFVYNKTDYDLKSERIRKDFLNFLIG